MLKNLDREVEELRLKYALTLVLFIAITLIISHLLLPIDMQLRVMHRYTIGTVISMQLLHYLLGALLGIEHLLEQFKESGRFMFNLDRFLIVGIPAFVLSIEYLEPYYVRVGLTYTPVFLLFLRMVFGYYLVTSICKQQTRP